MRFLSPEPKIKIYKEGFKNNDILGRRKIGQALSNFCENMETPAVIALNGAYGTGKSYFLQQWVGAHNLENDGKALTVYINAFNHDYLEDPLPALIMAIEARLAEGTTEAKQLFADVKKYSGILGKFFVRAGLASITSGASLIVESGVEAIGKAIADTANQEGNKALDAYWKEENNKQTAIRKLLEAIAKFAQEKKLVIVVDELDRARPDYALAMLEIIKHFFNVDNVHFILGLNMQTLGNSVQVLHGGTNAEALNYLKRFINLEYTLPDSVENGQAAQKAVLANIRHESAGMGLTPNIANAVYKHLVQTSKNYSISLRDAGKILSQTALVFGFQPKDSSLGVKIEVREIILTLITTSILDKALYHAFLGATITQEKIMHYYGLTAEAYAKFARRMEGHRWSFMDSTSEDYIMEYMAYMWIILTKRGELTNSETAFLEEKFDLWTPASRTEYIQKVQRDYIDIFASPING